jgi:hypothetical protein
MSTHQQHPSSSTGQLHLKILKGNMSPLLATKYSDAAENTRNE